jgi:hypothetical protein
MRISESQKVRFGNLIDNQNETKLQDRSKIGEYYLRAKNVPAIIAKIIMKLPFIKGLVIKKSDTFVDQFNNSRIKKISEATGKEEGYVKKTIDEDMFKNHAIITVKKINQICNKVESLKKISEHSETIKASLETVKSRYPGVETDFEKKTKEELTLIGDLAADNFKSIPETDFQRLDYLATKAAEGSCDAKIDRIIFPEVLQKLEGENNQIFEDYSDAEFPDKFYNLNWSDKIKEIGNFHKDLPSQFIDKLEIPPPNDIGFNEWYGHLKDLAIKVRSAQEQNEGLIILSKEKREEIILASLERCSENYTDFEQRLKEEIGEVNDPASYLDRVLENDKTLAQKMIGVLPPNDKYDFKAILQPALNRIIRHFDPTELQKMSPRELKAEIEWQCKIVEARRNNNFQNDIQAAWFLDIREKYQDMLSETLINNLFVLFFEVGLVNGQEAKRKELLYKLLDSTIKAKEKKFADDTTFIAITDFLTNQVKIQTDCLKWEFPENLENEIQNPYAAILNQSSNEDYKTGWKAFLEKENRDLAEPFMKEFGYGVPYTSWSPGWQPRDIYVGLYEKACKFMKDHPHYDKTAVLQALRETFINQVKIAGKSDAETVKKIAKNIPDDALISAANRNEFAIIAKSEGIEKLGVRLFSTIVPDSNVPLNRLGKANLKKIVNLIANLSRNEKWSDFTVEAKLGTVLRSPAFQKRIMINKLNKLSDMDMNSLIDSLEGGMRSTEIKCNLGQLKKTLFDHPEMGVERLLSEFAIEFQSPETVEESLKEIAEDIDNLRANPEKIDEAKEGMARIFRKIFPDEISGIGALLEIQGDQPVTIPLASAINKFQEALRAYKGPVGDRVELDKLPWNEQIVQLIVPQLMMAFKDVHGQKTLQDDKKTAFSKLVLDIFPKIENPGPLGRLLMWAIKSNPKMISKIAIFFQKPILKKAGEFFKEKVIEAKAEAALYEGKKGILEEKNDFVAQMSLGLFQLLSAAHEPVVKLGVRALPALVNNHTISAFLPLVREVLKAVESEEPNWDAVQKELIEALVHFSGELQQYDGLINNVVQELARLGA